MGTLFNLGGGEIILVLALMLILFGAKPLPDIARGLGEGCLEFRKAARKVGREVDQEAIDAGENLGGIYGKPAAEALTADNQVAELYDPAVLGETKRDAESFRWALAAKTFIRMILNIFRRITFWRH